MDRTTVYLTEVEVSGLKTLAKNLGCLAKRGPTGTRDGSLTTFLHELYAAYQRDPEGVEGALQDALAYRSDRFEVPDLNLQPLPEDFVPGITVAEAGAAIMGLPAILLGGSNEPPNTQEATRTGSLGGSERDV